MQTIYFVKYSESNDGINWKDGLSDLFTEYKDADEHREYLQSLQKNNDRSYYVDIKDLYGPGENQPFNRFVS